MCSDCDGGVSCGDTGERDELLAHLVDDGSISAAEMVCDDCGLIWTMCACTPEIGELEACANCGDRRVTVQCDSCHEWQCDDCWRYGRNSARLCPSCAAANSEQRSGGDGA